MPAVSLARALTVEAHQRVLLLALLRPRGHSLLRHLDRARALARGSDSGSGSGSGSGYGSAPALVAATSYCTSSPDALSSVSDGTYPPDDTPPGCCWST